jgi:hypothetical protein
MTPDYGTPRFLRRLILAPACAMIAVSFSWAQTAPAPTAGSKEATGPSTPPKVEEVVQLSPFEVKAEAKGYYSPNTMSGTRINSSIQDLASSITVVTKTQMQDFAMLDVNDIFLYAANTEGTGTYTDFVVDRNGSVADNVQLNPTQANRVRGIAPANISLDNIQTMGRVPIDPIDVDSVEISRGPNANVFGLGNPSGTVNLVPSSANVTRNATEVTARVDSYEGYRTTLDVNRVILPNKLAIRASGVFQHDGYERKPSGTNTVKYNGMLKYRPFKTTTISASVNYYRMNGNRPNALPPRDNISYWIASGRPTWDPPTGQIHVNGVTVGTYTSATYNGPDYFSATEIGATYNQMFIDQGGLGYWSAPQTTTNSTPLAGATTAGPTSGGQYDRFLLTTGFAGSAGTAARPSGQPLFTTTPTISDKSIYDWTSINLSAPNRLMDRTITTNLQLEQEFLNTNRQLLVGQVAFMREDSQRYQRNLLGIANDNGQSGQLQVDINERMLDGSANPYFLRPFIATGKPRTVWAPAKWDTYRAQLAYKLDLTHEQNWLKWLGMLQVTGYDEYKYQINRLYSYRDAIADNKTWIPPGLYRANQAAVAGTPALIVLTQGLYRYYVGDNVGNNIEYAPQEFKYGTYPFVWGNNTTHVFNTEPTTLGLTASTDSSGGTNNLKQVQKTVGLVAQSHLLKDSLVVTVGTREDRVFSRYGNPQPALLNADGETFNYSLINQWAFDYRANQGKTTTVQYVARPLQELSFLNDWDKGSGVGHFFADVLRGLSVNYNHSNSFIPTPPAQDLYLNVLPNPTGQDKSYGMGLNLLDGKVVLRVTHYETAQYNSRNSDANTICQRVIRTDLPLAGTTPARFVLQTVAGALTATTGPNNNQFGWIRTVNPTFTDQQVIDELAKEMQIPTALQTALINPSPPVAATNDVLARGTEAELNVNLTKFWTVSANFVDKQVYIKNVSSTLQKWIDQRMPVWTSLVDPAASTNWAATGTNSAANDVDAVTGVRGNPNHLWWIHNYGGSQSPQQNFIAFVQAPYAVIKALEGQAQPQTRRYNARVSTNVRLEGLTDNHFLRNFSVGGAVRWESPGAIGFYGNADANGVYQSLNVNAPIYDKARVYYDAVVSYKVKLFGGKVPASFQLNVRNLTEGGRLQPVNAYPDGTINTYRIIDPRQFILSATFDL